jgi:hypothetical protein
MTVVEASELPALHAFVVDSERISTRSSPG